MKKFVLNATLFVAIALLPLLTSCEIEDVFHPKDDGTVVVTPGDNNTSTENPACVQEFVNTHFSGVAIRKIEIDRDDYDYYEVKLANGFHLEFTQDCDWIGVDGNHTAIPQSIIDLLPVGIPQYVAANYPDRQIVEISKKRNNYGYEIELSGRGDIDLIFDANGTFLRRD